MTKKLVSSHTKKAHIILLFVFCAITSYSQSNLFADNMFGFNFRMTRTSPMEIEQLQVIASTKKKSRATIGFEMNIFYQRLFRNNFTFKPGVIIGIYSYETDVYFDDSFTDVGYDIDHFSTEYDPVYFGLSFEGNYIIPIIHNRGVLLGAGLNSIYFKYRPIDEGIFALNTSKIEFSNLYDGAAVINENRMVIISPKLSLGFYWKIGKKLFLNAGLNYQHSDSYPLKSSYLLIGGNGEKIEGSYKKKFAFGSVEIGLLF